MYMVISARKKKSHPLHLQTSWSSDFFWFVLGCTCQTYALQSTTQDAPSLCGKKSCLPIRCLRNKSTWPWFDLSWSMPVQSAEGYLSWTIFMSSKEMFQDQWHSILFFFYIKGNVWWRPCTLLKIWKESSSALYSFLTDAPTTTLSKIRTKKLELN